VNINPNLNSAMALPFLPPPPGAPATFVAAPVDSWTPSAPPTAAPAYQPAYPGQVAQPSMQVQAPTQPQAPVQDNNYQFACFRPENWTYPSSLTNNTYAPGTTGSQDPRSAILKQREEAFMMNRRNNQAGWNNYSRTIVDPNQRNGMGGMNGNNGYGNNGYGNNGYGNNGYGNNGYGNNGGAGSYLYGQPGGNRRPSY